MFSEFYVIVYTFYDLLRCLWGDISGYMLSNVYECIIPLILACCLVIRFVLFAVIGGVFIFCLLRFQCVDDTAVVYPEH